LRVQAKLKGGRNFTKHKASNLNTEKDKYLFQTLLSYRYGKLRPRERNLLAIS
jgi:hypothetical protein